MIHPNILTELSRITPEEQAALDGGNLDRSIYMNDGHGVVNADKLLRRGKLITIRPHTRFMHFPSHTHDYVEVVYMCRGKTVHIVNGKRLELQEGELLFLGQTAEQEILPAGENDVAVNFIILPAFFDRILQMMGEEETPLRSFIVASLGKGENSRGYLHFQVANILPIQNLVENLLWTLIQDTPNKRYIHQTTMGLLFMSLLNHTDKLANDTREDEVILQVYRYVEEQYRSGTLSELADTFPCDFYWLSREIKRKTGKTYTELVQEKRLSQAAFLLAGTAMKVSDISESVGYENVSYFHRLFYARYRMSPKDYRRANKDTF